MVVGTQKAATTWLFECLLEHPEVFVSDQKEVHFFCRPEDCRFSTQAKGLDWYRGLFSEGGKRAYGELTTDYMFFPYVAEDLHALNPDLKIVFILRNPVDRAYSAYWMWKRHKPTLPPFREMLDQNPPYIERGLYHRQVLPYLELFGAENVRIYIYEEITRDAAAFLENLYKFIGVDPSCRPTMTNDRVSGTRVLPGAAGFVLYKIISPIINAPIISSIWRALRRTAPVRRLINSNGSETPNYPQMSDADRTYLKNRFEDENERLFEMLGRRVESWPQ